LEKKQETKIGFEEISEEKCEKKVEKVVSEKNVRNAENLVENNENNQNATNLGYEVLEDKKQFMPKTYKIVKKFEKKPKECGTKTNWRPKYTFQVKNGDTEIKN
jgi:hypothetical protein